MNNVSQISGIRASATTATVMEALFEFWLRSLQGATWRCGLPTALMLAVVGVSQAQDVAPLPDSQWQLPTAIRYHTCGAPHHVLFGSMSSGST